MLGSVPHGDRAPAFARGIWAWFARHKRVLPWRDLALEDENERAYRILVSEVMLQQTQVPRVMTTYRAFLERFPRLRDLAAATNAEVILAWRGMGYNSRALRLRDAARHIVQDRGGAFPREMEELLAIKGIGQSPAAGIRNFAFRLPAACLDTTIRRIIHRVFIGPETPEGTWPKNDRELLPVAERTLRVALDAGPAMTGADWHAALMDFGSLVCTKRAPACPSCPLKDVCRSACKVPSLLPRAKRAPKVEPGRQIGGVFIPNRIFRGRAVEALRDAPDGLTLDVVGRTIAPDWDVSLEPWLTALLARLIHDELVEKRGDLYVLHAGA